MPFRTVFAVLAFALVGNLTASARADEASRQEVVVEMFHALHYDRLIDQMADAVASQITGQIKTKHPSLDAESISDIQDMTREAFSSLKPGLMLFVGQSMVKHFNEEELRQILAFYKTDVGRKTIAVMPQMMQETMVWSQQSSGRVVPQLVESIRARLKEKGYGL